MTSARTARTIHPSRHLLWAGPIVNLWMNHSESSVFTGYCCSCNLVQIWCRDPIAMLMSMQHLGCWVLHEALTICLFSTWFSRTTWHQMYLDCLGLFRGCSNFAWMALQDKCERIVFGVLSVSLDGCNLVVRCCGQFGESKNVYIISYVILNDFLMVNGCFGAFHSDVLGRYGMDQFHCFHPLNTRTSVQRLYL